MTRNHYCNKYYVVAGDEFGPDLKGRTLKIVHALYGLKSAGAAFRAHLASILRTFLKFQPCQADPDVWMRRAHTADGNLYYEYISSSKELLVGVWGEHGFVFWRCHFGIRLSYLFRFRMFLTVIRMFLTVILDCFLNIVYKACRVVNCWLINGQFNDWDMMPISSFSGRFSVFRNYYRIVVF